MSSASLTIPKLTALPFAALEWFIIWLIRYLPTRIKNSVIRVLVQIAFGGSIFGVWLVQGTLYQSMTGVRILKNDHFFMGLTIIEHVVGVCLLYRIAFERRKKERTETR